MVMARKLLSLLGVAWLAALLFSPPPAAQAQDETTWLLDQINTLRAGLGLPPYALNASLSAAAAQHSQYMAAACDITHVESNGSTPQSRAAANGYGGTNVSENIYGGGIARASDAWDFWIHSPVHYAGLTSDYETEVGIGIAGGLCNTYTLDFGHGGSAAAPAVAVQPAAGQAAAPPAPTRYIPPAPTFTPTPTILTLTPSATWTLTPTHTPSFTPTLPPPTLTASPTVAETATPAAAAAVAFVSSPTETPSLLPPTFTPIPPSPMPVITALPAARKESKGLEMRNLIPFALVGQIVLIGLAGFAYFRRSR
jgi:hypothetical protein